MQVLWVPFAGAADQRAQDWGVKKHTATLGAPRRQLAGPVISVLAADGGITLTGYRVLACLAAPRWGRTFSLIERS